MLRNDSHDSSQPSNAKPKRERRKFRDRRLRPARGKSKVIWCRVLDPNGSGKKVRLSTFVTDETAASAKADDYERTATNPRYRAGKGTTLEDAILDLQVAMKLKGKSDGTIRAVTTRLGTFIRFWGADFPIGNLVDGRPMAEYLKKRSLEKGRKGNPTVSPTTIGVEVNALRALLKRAIHLGNFAGRVDEIAEEGYGRQANAIERYPTIEQAKAIVKDLATNMPRKQLAHGRGKTAMGSRQIAAHVAYMFGTGARAEEVRRARREDWHQTFVTVHGEKTKHCRLHAREIPRSPICEPFLAYAMENAAPGPVPFPSSQGCIREAVADACRHLGFEHFSPNDFRRAVCQWHLWAGYTEKFCAGLLRHKDTAMVKLHYGQMDRKGEALVERMKSEQARIKSGMHLVPDLYLDDTSEAVQPGPVSTTDPKLSEEISRSA
jgi:integrase